MVVPTYDRVSTHVGTHARHKHDTSSALRDHVTRGLARSEERAMDVDVIEPLYAIEGVAGRRAPVRYLDRRVG